MVENYLIVYIEIRNFQ